MTRRFKNRVIAASMALLMAASLTPANLYSGVFTTPVLAAEGDVAFNDSASKAGDVIAKHDGVTFTAICKIQKCTRLANGIPGVRTNNVTVMRKGAEQFRGIGVVTVDEDISITFPTYLHGSGKKVIVVKSDTELSFDSVVEITDEQIVAAVIGTANETVNMTFEAQAGKFYYVVGLSTTNENGVGDFTAEKVVPVDVTFALDNVDAEAEFVSDAVITLTDTLTLEKKEVNAGALTFTLKKGHTYKLTTNSGRLAAKVNDEDSFKAEDAAVTIKLYNVPSQTLTGKITGTPAGTVTKLTFTENTTKKVVEAVIDGDSYSAALPVGEYTTAVVASNGGKTNDHVSIKVAENQTNEVYVEVPDASDPVTYGGNNMDGLTVTGGTIASHNNGALIKTGAGTVITVPVSGKATVALTLNYSGKITMSSAGAEDVVVDIPNTTGTTANITANGNVTLTVGTPTDTSKGTTTYIETIVVTPITDVEFKNAISIPEDFATFADALAGIKKMSGRPEGEDGRVTITLNKDLQEQVKMDVDYVTLKGNNHTIQWYYGVGTRYYSVGTDGYYSEALARDKYSANEASGSLWGGAFIVLGNNFIAEDTTFKNTYNYELVEAEKTDIAGGSLGTLRLKEGADVASYDLKERSSALLTQGDNMEIYNCKILSSQDTLGYNGDKLDIHLYFKNCVIGGNVDYICGGFTAIFDDCELQWKTYSNDANGNNAKIGYIVAPKTKPYIFRDCKVTVDNAEAKDVQGQFGRTWGEGSKAIFLRTETNGFINLNNAWGEMKSGEGKSAVFNDSFNMINGKATKSSKPAADEVVLANFDTAETSVATVNLKWTPVHYATKTAPEIKRYTITNSEAKNGTVAIDKTEALEGEEVTVTATPDDGYAVDKITVKDAEGKEVAVSKDTFVMPASNVTVSVTFKTTEKLYDITLSYENGFSADKTYGDKDIITFTVGEDMPAKTNSEGISYAQGNTNPSPNKGAVPTAGAFIKLVAVRDTTIKFVMNPTEKTYYLVCEDGSEEAKTGTAIEENMNFNLTAGKTYYYYAQGSKLMIKSITYQSLSEEKPGEGDKPSGGEGDKPADTVEWKEEDGVKYWYENGVKQGTEGRGKEIYDPSTDAWYFLDAADGGKMATNKDVAQPIDWDAYNADPDGYGLDNSKWKWVRYDENGHMVKGWDNNENGAYYFDLITGQMAKGAVEIGNKACYFDEVTGVGADVKWLTIDGVEYWYEGGVRQGYEIGNEAYRGKEIFDPETNAWYWLDNIDGGKKAVSKDVYQESLAGDWGDMTNEAGEKIGKWVRYDAQGHMIKGWSADHKYYFDPVFGTMAKGTAVIDGKTYNFDPVTGILVE